MVKKIWFSLSDIHVRNVKFIMQIFQQTEKNLASCSAHRFHYIPPNTQRISGKLVFLLLGLVRKEVTYIKGDLDPRPPPKTADLQCSLCSERQGEDTDVEAKTG